MNKIAGAWLVIVIMAVAAGSSAPLAPPAADVTGNWGGTWQYESAQMGAGDMRGSFQQDGNKISGNFQVTGPVLNRVATISGVISGNEIILSSPASGRLTVSGTEMSGQINGLNVAKVTLRKM